MKEKNKINIIIYILLILVILCFAGYILYDKLYLEKEFTKKENSPLKQIFDEDLIGIYYPCYTSIEGRKVYDNAQTGITSIEIVDENKLIYTVIWDNCQTEEECQPFTEEHNYKLYSFDDLLLLCLEYDGKYILQYIGVGNYVFSNIPFGQWGWGADGQTFEKK